MNKKNILFLLQSLKSHIVSKSLFEWELSSNITRARVNFILLGFLLIFITLIIRLIIIAGSDYISTKNILQTKLIHRLDIIDRNNNLLAVNLPGSSLYASPRKVIDPEDAVNKLLSVIQGLDKNKVLADLKSNKKFIWIKRDITPIEHEKIYNLDFIAFI